MQTGEPFRHSTSAVMRIHRATPRAVVMWMSRPNPFRSAMARLRNRSIARHDASS